MPDFFSDLELTLLTLVKAANGFLWDNFLAALLVAAGVWFTETAAGSLRIYSDGGMRHSSIPESNPAQGTLISQPCAKVLP